IVTGDTGYPLNSTLASGSGPEHGLDLFSDLRGQAQLRDRHPGQTYRVGAIRATLTRPPGRGTPFLQRLDDDRQHREGELLSQAGGAAAFLADVRDQVQRVEVDVRVLAVRRPGPGLAAGKRRVEDGAPRAQRHQGEADLPALVIDLLVGQSAQRLLDLLH